MTAVAVTTRLAELTQQWNDYFRAVEANDGVVTPELEAKHEVLQIDSAIKVDGYYFRIEALEGQVARMKKVRQDLEKREKALAAAIAHMEDLVWDHMEARGLEELRGEVLQGFKIQDAGGVRSLEMVVTDASRWPSECWREPEVDPTKVRARLGPTGETVEDSSGTVLARLKPRGKVLRRYV